MRKIFGVSIVALLAGAVSANAQSQNSTGKPDYYRRHTIAKGAHANAFRHRHGHRNSGPIYGRGYMNCINSGHPADFCENDSVGFRD
jgi:hypothetical protein